MDEPHITVNGQELTTGQAMAVRVALSNFFIEMGDPDALGDDEHGRAMVAAYSARAAEVLRLMGVAA